MNNKKCPAELKFIKKNYLHIFYTNFFWGQLTVHSFKTLMVQGKHDPKTVLNDYLAQRRPSLFGCMKCQNSPDL